MITGSDRFQSFTVLVENLLCLQRAGQLRRGCSSVYVLHVLANSDVYIYRNVIYVFNKGPRKHVRNSLLYETCDRSTPVRLSVRFMVRAPPQKVSITSHSKILYHMLPFVRKPWPRASLYQKKLLCLLKRQRLFVFQLKLSNLPTKGQNFQSDPNLSAEEV